jgi:hypothetical protein
MSPEISRYVKELFVAKRIPMARLEAEERHIYEGF